MTGDKANGASSGKTGLPSTSEILPMLPPLGRRRLPEPKAAKRLRGPGESLPTCTFWDRPPRLTEVGLTSAPRFPQALQTNWFDVRQPIGPASVSGQRGREWLHW